MSAWVVSHHHIAAIVGTIHARAPALIRDAGGALVVAAMLARENVASVAYRYDEKPEPAPIPTAAEIAAFRFRPLAPGCCATQLRCWRYQSCERPDHAAQPGWQLSERMLEALRSLPECVGHKDDDDLPGAAGAPWGWDWPATHARSAS